VDLTRLGLAIKRDNRQGELRAQAIPGASDFGSTIPWCPPPPGAGSGALTLYVKTANAPIDIVKMKQMKKNVSQDVLESEWGVSAIVILSSSRVFSNE